MSEVAVAPSQQLRVVLTNMGLEEDRAVLIAEKFGELFNQGNEWAEKAKTISVTSSEQVVQIKQAREGRLFLKGRRVAIENLRKSLKERSLVEGRAIDTLAKHLTGLVEPTERYLEEQETFPLREKARLRRELIDSRLERLKPFGAGASEGDLATWTEEEFVAQVNAAREQYDAAQQQKQQAEQQRQFEAREKEELRKANKRLVNELREQQARHFEVTKELEVQQKITKSYQDDQRKLREYEDQKRQEQFEQERQESLASDRDKLTKLASSLSRAAIPHVESREAADIVDRVEQMLTDIETFIQREAAKL